MTPDQEQDTGSEQPSSAHVVGVLVAVLWPCPPVKRLVTRERWHRQEKAHSLLGTVETQGFSAATQMQPNPRAQFLMQIPWPCVGVLAVSQTMNVTCLTTFRATSSLPRVLGPVP